MGEEADNTPCWLRELDHTADVGFVVEAGGVEELYARAAWGLFAVIAELGGVEPREEVGVVVTAADREGLLVRWLSELNYRHLTERWLFCRFEVMDRAVKKYQIELPDRQLACAPVDSPEGEAYLGAMRCAINYAFANRQVIAEGTRRAFRHALKLTPSEIGLRTVYEVAHNIAKFEVHTVNGRERRLCVHRKGATRAFGPGRLEVPSAYQRIGQPVLIPGDMGRYSYVLTGTAKAMAETFGSTCHGAGRALSRVKAKQAARGRDVVKELARKGIVVRGQSRRTVDEEISEAYKDVAHVVDVCALAGISNKVVQLKPLGCIKG